MMNKHSMCNKSYGTCWHAVMQCSEDSICWFMLRSMLHKHSLLSQQNKHAGLCLFLPTLQLDATTTH
jgi:hypothetical protein